MVVNFITILDSAYRVDLDFDMSFVVDEDFRHLWEAVTYRTYALFWLMLAEFVILWSFTVVMVFQNAAHFQRHIFLDDLF